MAERKDFPNRIPLEEVNCFPQWSTFSWENVTDAMRKSIEENALYNSLHSNAACGNASSESSEAESESQMRNPKPAKLPEIGETERQLFADSAQFFKAITTRDDHPSQLVDALKVGLADILSGSGSDDNSHVSVDDFSKSLDTSFDNVKPKATQTIGTIRHVSTGSSGSEDDLSDFSTTESRESVGMESSHSMDASTEIQEREDVDNTTKEERPVTEAPDKETEGAKSSIPDEQPEPKKEEPKDMLGDQNENAQSYDYDDDSFSEEEDEEEEDMKKEEPDKEESEDIWAKGILAEDLMNYKNYTEKEQTKRFNSNQAELEPDSEQEDDKSDFLQSEDDLSPNARTYADVVKAGLDPDAVTYVMKPCVPPLYQKRAPREAKPVAAKKARKERRPKRLDFGQVFEFSFDQQRARRVQHGKRGTSTIPPHARAAPQTYVGKGKNPGAKVKRGGKNTALFPGPKTIQEKTNHTKKLAKNRCEGDKEGDEIRYRKKIQEEHIAKVLQEAKLTLAKLTTESLGSYEKVSCLKSQQPPIVCHNTFEVLQSQEINKAKHMKELANRLHQLTEMGVGNAEEFAEIKDILSSLHYLQTKEKYFVEPKEKRKRKTTMPLKKTKSDKSIYWFLVIAMVLLILLFMFRRQWMAFVIFSSIFIFCIQQVKKILEFFDGGNEQDNCKDKK